ncbi:hypothetical protein [Pedobacter sp. NJ-S-72]
MYKQIKYTIGKLTAKGFRPFTVCLLIVICLLSSCTVRKGIQSFFSDTVAQNNLSGKLAKNLLVKQSSFTTETIDCFSAHLNSSADELMFKQSALKTSMVMLFAFILPGFILSLLVSFKKLTHLPAPESQLRWSVIPLFLQNSLLLI